MLKSQIANLNLTQIKAKNKRMKETDTTEDSNVVYESYRKKNISIAKSKV